MIDLAILIPSVYERKEKLSILTEELLRQTTNHNVIVISLCDNRKITIGEKRQKLLDMCEAKYFAFVDDDDWISEDYIESLVDGISQDSDVVTFNQQAEINGEIFKVSFHLKSAAAELSNDEEYNQRPAWHCCAWKTEKVKPYAKFSF